jgi:hypothetical protein
MGGFPFDSSLWDESSPAFIMLKEAYDSVTASYGNIAMLVLFLIAVFAQIWQYVVCFISWFVSGCLDIFLGKDQYTTPPIRIAQGT